MDCFAALAMTRRRLAITWRRLAMTWSSRHAFATLPRHAPEALAQPIARAVIASEAKQSIAPQRKNGLLRGARNDAEEARNDVEERRLTMRSEPHQSEMSRGPESGLG